MKAASCIPVLFLWLCHPAHAQFSGHDNFSGIKDLTLWGADVAQGGGTLSEAGDGVVHYTSISGVPAADYWPWLVGTAPITNSWTALIDVKVPPLEFTNAPGSVGIGLIVFNGTNTSQSMTILLEQRGSGLSAPDFASEAAGAGSAPRIATNSQTATAAVRIRWDVLTQTLSGEYDPDSPASGQPWTAVRVFNPTLVSTWSTPTNGVFRVGVIGQSQEAINMADEVYADNFVTTLIGIGNPGPAPSLSVALNGSLVTLSWPSPSVGFGLQAAPDATSGAWQGLSNSPDDDGVIRSVTLPADTGSQFFRLIK